MNSRPLPFRIAPLLGTLLLAFSCASQAAPEAEQGVFSQAPQTELTPQILYQLLFAEVAGSRGQVPLSVAAYVDLAQSTRDPRIAQRAAEVALSSRQYDAALAATRVWVEQEPNSATAQQMAVTLAAAFGRLDEVAAHLSRSLDLDPDNAATALLRLNRLLARMPDKVAVYPVVVNATEPYLKLPEAYFARAQAAYAAKNFPQAQLNVAQALEMRPDWEYAVLLKALLVQNEPAQVIAILEPFVRAYPNAMDARLGLARTLVADRKFEAALKEFQAVLERQPGNGDVMYATALLSLQVGDMATAESLFLRLLEMKYVESNLIRTYLGQMAEEKKDDKAAAAWYASVTQGPQFLSSQIRAAQLTARQGDLTGARVQLQRAKPADEAGQVQLLLAESSLLREKDRHEESYALLDKALKAKPDNPELLYEAGLGADRLRKFDVAEKLWQKLIKLKPDHAHAYNALGYSIADRGVRLDEAQRLIDKALTLLPDDPFILDSKGWVQYRKGEKAEALATLQQAFSRRPDPEIAAHIGEVLWAMGRQDDARKVWDEALRGSPNNQTLAETIKKFQP